LNAESSGVDFAFAGFEPYSVSMRSGTPSPSVSASGGAVGVADGVGDDVGAEVGVDVGAGVLDGTVLAIGEADGTEVAAGVGVDVPTCVDAGLAVGWGAGSVVALEVASAVGGALTAGTGAVEPVLAAATDGCVARLAEAGCGGRIGVATPLADGIGMAAGVAGRVVAVAAIARESTVGAGAAAASASSCREPRPNAWDTSGQKATATIATASMIATAIERVELCSSAGVPRCVSGFEAVLTMRRAAGRRRRRLRSKIARMKVRAVIARPTNAMAQITPSMMSSGVYLPRAKALQIA
jgi:hypothetical protein